MSNIEKLFVIFLLGITTYLGSKWVGKLSKGI